MINGEKIMWFVFVWDFDVINYSSINKIDVSNENIFDLTIKPINF